MSRQKSFFGGIRRKFFSKRTFSEDEAVALFGGSGEGHPGSEITGAFENAFQILRFQQGGVSGDLSGPSHDGAPADASLVTGAFESALQTLRFQQGGVSGDLSEPSHDGAPADASSVTGGYALIP